MSAADVQTIAFVVTAFAAMLALYYSRSEDRHRRGEKQDKVLVDKIDARVRLALDDSGLKDLGQRMNERMARMETTMDIFTRAVALDAARALHSPHPEMKRRDVLLEKLLGGDISPTEQGELYRMLYGSAFGPHTEGLPTGDRVAASLVLRLLESMDEEQRQAAERLHTLDQPTMTCLLSVDAQGRISSLQGDFEGVLGWEVGQLSGAPVSVVVPLWGRLEEDAVSHRLKIDVPLDVPHHQTIVDSVGRERPVWVTLRPNDDGISVKIESRDPDATLSTSPLH